MKIGEYEQMMSYLTRPAAETRENFDDGSGPLAGLDRKTREPGKGIKKIKIESVEENIKKITYLNKETGETIDIYKALISDAPKKIDGKQIAGVGGDYKTLLSEEFSTLEEAQKARDDFREKNPKKYPEKDPNKDYASKEKRRAAEKATQGRIIAFGAPEGYVAHHMKPLAGRLDMTDRDIAIVSERMNAKMSKFDKPMNDLVDESMALDFNDTKSMKRLDEINKELADYVKQAEKELPKKYKGLIGFNKLTPVLDTFDNEGRQIFDIEEVGTDYKKSIGGKKKGIPLRDTKTGVIREQVANAPKLKASLIPGLEKIGNEIAQGIKNIPDDIKKKKFFKLGLKALGPLGTYIAVDDTYEAFKKGKSFAESIEYGLIGTNIVGSTKDLLALSPEEREARSVVKQAEMADQIAQDESMLDSDFETPKVKSDLTDEEAKRKYQLAQERIEAENKENEAKIARARAISMSGLKDLITGKRFAGQEMPTQYMAAGGRIGFADGPDDPSRRKFMKIAGGIASIPIVGKFLKPAMVAAPKVVEVVKRGVDGTPEFLGDLITKIVTFGKKNFTGNRADEFADQYRLDDYVVTQQGNKTTIQKFDDPDNPNYKEIEIELETDPETGGVTYNEASVRPDAEGKLKDVEEYVDDLDLEDMRKYTYDE